MLTATKQSLTGYWIEPLKKNLYSLEEINYFLYNHINLVYRDFFSEELFTFIERNLEQPMMAADLRDISKRGGTTADFVKYLLTESYYYNSRELADISGLVAGIDTMTQGQRLKLQGDACYRAGNMNSALRSYLDVLREAHTKQDSDSFYSIAAYCAGKIYASMFMSKSANAFFTYAYELYPDPMYARACIYMSIISGDDEELLSSIVKFRISDDELDAMKARVRSLRREVENSAELAQFTENIKSQEYADAMVQHWKEQYYEMLK